MKKTFIFSIAVVVLAACTEIQNEELEAGFPYSLTATIDMTSAPSVRANFTNPNPANPATATWTIDWKVGDEIRVFNQTGKENSVVYVVKSINEGTAKFAPKDGEDLSKFSEAKVFFAAKGGVAENGGVAPYLYNFNSEGEGGISTGLYTYKSIKEGSIDNDFFLAVAKATLTDGKLNFQFIPVVSYIRITIPDGLNDIGSFYFQSTVSGGTANPSGFFRVRMNLNENTIKQIGQRYSGGSANAPFFYGEGNSSISTPYPAFHPGSYYFPVIPKCTVRQLVIKDLSGTAKRTIKFTSPAFDAGKIYDFGAIPTD